MKRQRYFGLGGSKFLISLKSAAGSLISKDRSVEEHLTNNFSVMIASFGLCFKEFDLLYPLVH